MIDLVALNSKMLSFRQLDPYFLNFLGYSSMFLMAKFGVDWCLIHGEETHIKEFLNSYFDKKSVKSSEDDLSSYILIKL
jgi:hypothetical protein